LAPDLGFKGVPANIQEHFQFSAGKVGHEGVKDSVGDLEGKVPGIPKYGEFAITPALMMGMKGTTLARIAFGGVKKGWQSVWAHKAPDGKWCRELGYAGQASSAQLSNITTSEG
jgi:hypothetical protein